MKAKMAIALSLVWSMGLVISLTTQATAQMVHTVVPMQNIGSTWFESSSVDWSIRGPGWFANFGGNGPLLPPFGGPVAGGGLSTGIGFAGGGVSGNLGLNFAQGSSRSISSTTASVTTMDGAPGSISSGVIRPFVTGFTPIVGNYDGAVAPLNQAAQASELRGRMQYENLRRSQATLHQQKLATYVNRAQRAERDGNKRMARANYRSAIALAPEPLKSQLKLHLKTMMQRKPASQRGD